MFPDTSNLDLILLDSLKTYLHFTIFNCYRSINNNRFNINEIDDGGKAIGTDGCADVELHFRCAQHAEQTSTPSRSQVGPPFRGRKQEYDGTGWR